MKTSLLYQVLGTVSSGCANWGATLITVHGSSFSTDNLIDSLHITEWLCNGAWDSYLVSSYDCTHTCLVWLLMLLLDVGGWC